MINTPFQISYSNEFRCILMHLLEIELDLNESYGEYGNSGLNIEMNLSE